jgi:hypothetical protein
MSIFFYARAIKIILFSDGIFNKERKSIDIVKKVRIVGVGVHPYSLSFIISLVCVVNIVFIVMAQTIEIFFILLNCSLI